MSRRSIIFELLRGTHKGTKVASSIAELCQSTVNQQILNGAQLKIEDTAFILQQFYILYIFKASLKNKNQTYIGALSVQVQNILMDWLGDVYDSVDSDYDFSGVIQDWCGGLDVHYLQWFKELGNENPEMAGADASQWLPLALDRTINQITACISDRGALLAADWSNDLRTSLDQRLSSL